MSTGNDSRPKTSLSGTSMASVSGSECVKVAVRCRPFSDIEIAKGYSRIVRTIPSRGCVEVQTQKDASLQQPAKCFFYDAIYGEDAKQLDLYDETVRGIVDSVLQGFNGTVFAYGQTGTGKTYTMEGHRDDPAQRGVIPNAIEHIFQHIAHSPPNQQYLVRASFLEIYQEEIIDLLSNSRNVNKRLELRERPDVGVYVKNLSSFVTKSVEEIEHVLNVGHANRSVGRTNMNEHSSRSHSIFMVTVECSETDQAGDTHIRVGRLNLVDLAGSERQAKTGSEGQRFREATKINLSLSALGNVISALSDRNSAHIPYRDSKLTRLLQDSLGGNSKTVMIANIGPSSYNIAETLSTLRYSSRAKQIENRPKINEDPKDALLREFQDEIARLKEMLEERRRQMGKTLAADWLKKTQRRANAANGKENDTHEREAEEYAQEQQLKLEMERERLLKNGEIIEEERKRILTELEARERELERERESQLAVAAKIRAMQSKLLSGDGNLLDRTRRQEELLHQRRAELAEQRRREREIALKLESQELEAAEVRHTFANLQQEVEAKRRKLQKLNTKLESLRLDLQDTFGANTAERQGLEQTVLEMNKELALKWLLIDNFVPPAVVDWVRRRARFDDTEQGWSIRGTGEQSTTSNGISTQHSTMVLVDSGGWLNNEHRSPPNPALLNPLPLPMADSGLGSSNGGSQGPCALEEADDLQQSSSKVFLELKRPIALTGARRPISNWELSALVKVRQKLAQHRLSAARQLPKTPPDLSIPEEILRFASENLLTFHSLIRRASEVRPTTSYDASKIPETHQPWLVLDASRIPIMKNKRAHMHSIRPGSATGSNRSSLARSAIIQHQQPKNVRARSVFSGVIRQTSSEQTKEAQIHSANPKIIQGTRRGSTARNIGEGGGEEGGDRNTVLFPKARGLVGGIGGRF